MEHERHESVTGRGEVRLLRFFVEVTKAITSCLNVDEVLALIARKIPQLMDVDAATIRLLDASGKKLVLKAAHGLSEAYLNRGPIDTEEPVFKALKGEPIFIEDAARDPRINYPQATNQEGIKSILVIPIPIRGKISGVLRLLAKSSLSCSQDEIAFLRALGEHLLEGSLQPVGWGLAYL